MDKQETQTARPAPRKVALFVRDDYFLLLSVSGNTVTTMVKHLARQHPAISELHADESVAEEKFRTGLRNAPQHNWSAFYVGSPLQG